MKRNGWSILLLLAILGVLLESISTKSVDDIAPLASVPRSHLVLPPQVAFLLIGQICCPFRIRPHFE
jgi:hypothetical protein